MSTYFETSSSGELFSVVTRGFLISSAVEWVCLLFLLGKLEVAQKPKNNSLHQYPKISSTILSLKIFISEITLIVC